MSDHNQTQLHKTATISSKEWVSPFRASGGKNVKAEKLATLETAEDESRKIPNKGETVDAGVATQKELQKDEEAESEEALETEEPLIKTEESDIDDDAEDEEPLENQEAAAIEKEQNEEEEEEAFKPATDSEDASQVAEEVVLPNARDAKVSEPAATEESKAPAKEVKPALQEIPQNIKKKPKMLGRYKENFNIASQVMNKNHIEYLDRRIDLGAGLVLTEQQIYDLAKKKLEPLMKQIDNRVAENNARDAEKAAKIEEGIRKKDEAVVAQSLASYKSIIENKKKEVQAEHDNKFKELEDKAAKSKEDYEKYLEDEKDGIVKDDEDSKKAEEKAVDDHLENKKKLLTDYFETKENKAKELEEVKTKQTEESNLIEKFDKDTSDLRENYPNLQSKLEAKKAELEELIKKSEALVKEKHEKHESHRKAVYRKKVADRSFNIINSTYSKAAANVALLGTQIGLLENRFNAHSTKIEHLNTAGKERLVNKKADASKAADTWDQHLSQVRLEEAQKQEQIRIAAEEERKRIELEKKEEEERLAKEKEEEEARLAKEKEEEEARLAKEKEEEEARLAKEKEEARILAEKKKKEEEEEAARVAEEVQRLKRLNSLKEEKIALQKKLEEQKKAELAAGSKKEKSSNVGTAAIAAGGAALGATGAAIGATIGGVSSGAGNAVAGVTSNLPTMGKTLDPFKNFSTDASETSYQDELKNSTANTSSAVEKSLNPFYTGDFNDKDDLPSTIHEEEHSQHTLELPKGEKKDVDGNVEEVVQESKPEGDSKTVDNEVEIPTTSSTAAAPVANRRRSMVEEALAHKTPEELAKINVPLEQQVKLSPKKTSVKEPASPAPRSRSGSFFKRRNSLSRTNSIKADNSKQTQSRSRRNSTASSSSKSATPVSAPVTKSPVKAKSPTASSTPIEKSTDKFPESSTDANATVRSLAPSGLSTAEVSEAKAVRINTDHETPKKLTSKEENDEEDDVDSDLEPASVNPVFTEKIGGPEVPASTTATSGAPAKIEEDSDAYTLETVDSAEFKANRDDPNYMVLKT